MNQRYDVFGFGTALLAAAIFLWSGLYGPIYNIQWKLEPGSLAEWALAVVSALTIFGVYWAATIPVRAEREAKALEDYRRAVGLALLLIPELLALLGAIQRAKAKGSIADEPVEVPSLIQERADQFYLWGEAGGRVLQTIGLLSGMANQTRSYRHLAGDLTSLTPHNRKMGQQIWQNHIQALDLAAKNIEEAVERLQTLIEMKDLLTGGNPVANSSQTL